MKRQMKTDRRRVIGGDRNSNIDQEPLDGLCLKAKTLSREYVTGAGVHVIRLTWAGTTEDEYLAFSVPSLTCLLLRSVLFCVLLRIDPTYSTLWSIVSANEALSARFLVQGPSHLRSFLRTALPSKPQPPLRSRHESDHIPRRSKLDKSCDYSSTFFFKGTTIA